MAEEPRDAARTHGRDGARLQRVFTAALALPHDERDAFVARECADDRALAGEVTELLLHRDRAGDGFLAEPVWAPFARQWLPDLVLVPGDAVGGFVLERLLGAGGRGSVFRARGPDGVVALKTMPLRSEVDGRRLREAWQRVARLAQPNLAPVLAHGEDARGFSWSAMRLVEGPALAEVAAAWQQTGARPAGADRALLARFAEVAAGLAAMHAAGLLHLDVKPANILLEGVDGAPPWAGRAVLVDYELVRPAAAAQPGVTLWASVDFAAPELLLGRTVDARADLFALGVTMHDVFAGRAPRQRTRALADGLEDLRRCRAGIDPGVAELVAALVEPTARWREDSAARTARELTRLARGERFAASPALRLHRLLVRRRRRVARATWLSLTGLLAVAVIALAGDSVRTAVATSESATVAWRRGDLVSAAEALRRPTWLARRLLPARLTALAAGSEPGADPVEDVLSVVFAGDIAGARLRAAQYLERDGLAPHPQLSWFLADALSRDRTQVRVLWTRIFHECPDASPAAVAASAAIRAAFTALLDDDGPDAVWAAAALGGCGDQRSFVAVAAAIVQRLRAGGPSQCEFARVAMMCLRRIVGRSVVCGFDRAVAGAADERLARELGDALRPLDPDLVNARLAPALTDLTTQLAVLGRRANDDRHLPLLALLVEPQRTRVRAAAGDAALRSTLLAGGSCDLDWLGEGQASRFTLADHLGYIAGALGGDDVCAACRRLLDRAGPGGEREFESSRAAGQATARGPTTLEPPDEDSHLGASLRAERTQPIAVACRCSALVAPRVFDCDLTHWPPVLQGEAQQVEAVAVTWPADEVMPDICFARLHLPALSALTFCLPAGPARSASLDLHLCMQKGVRSALPGEGEARVDLLLDGEPIGLGLLVAASTQCDLQVPLCRSSTTPRRLTVRLGAGSTTTLRLYSVSVAAH